MKDDIREILEAIQENDIYSLSDLYNFYLLGMQEEIEEFENLEKQCSDKSLFFSQQKLKSILMYPNFFVEAIKEKKENEINKTGKKLIEKTYYIEE